MSIYKTSTIKQTCTFTDQNGTVFDPTTVTCTVYHSSGLASATYTYSVSTYPPAIITKISTGVYQIKLDVSVKGTYTLDWYGANSSGKISSEESFEVIGN